MPLFFVVPGLDRPVRVSRVASALDIAPTVLDLLGRMPVEEFQGKSLLGAEPRMSLFFTDYSQALVGLRDGRWKYVHAVESGRSKLFDLKSDPLELRNLAESTPERVSFYRGRLLRWCAAQRASVLDAQK